MAKDRQFKSTASLLVQSYPFLSHLKAIRLKQRKRVCARLSRVRTRVVPFWNHDNLKSNLARISRTSAARTYSASLLLLPGHPVGLRN